MLKQLEMAEHAHRTSRAQTVRVMLKHLRDRAFMTNLIVRGLGGSQTGVTSETDAVSRV